MIHFNNKSVNCKWTKQINDTNIDMKIYDKTIHDETIWYNSMIQLMKKLCDTTLCYNYRLTIYDGNYLIQ